MVLCLGELILVVKISSDGGVKKRNRSLMFENVKTYLNSGNVIFQVEKILKRLQNKLKKC